VNPEAVVLHPQRPHAPLAVRRALAAVASVEAAVAVGGLCAAAALMLADVAVREGLVPLARALGFDAMAWVPRGLSRYALYGVLISAFAGFAVSTSAGTHLGSGLGQLPLPAALVRQRERIGHALTGLVFAAAAWYAARFVWGSYTSGLRAAFLSWPVWPIQAVLPLALGSSALRSLCYAAWPALRGGEPEPGR